MAGVGDRMMERRESPDGLPYRRQEGDALGIAVHPVRLGASVDDRQPETHPTNFISGTMTV